jgi:hypothetical protein
LTGAASRPSLRWSALAAAATVLLGACAIFQDLDSSPYTLVDAGSEGGACVPDSGNTSLAIGCNPPCSGDDFCCVTPSATGMPTTACKPGAQCGAESLSIALCNACECPIGTTCASQTCTFSGFPFEVKACGSIPSCSTH